MGYKYEESILKNQQKYVVQDVTKFPKTESYMIGSNVLLTDLHNTSASIVTNGRKKWIPARALIKVKGFEAKAVRAKNADGFAIVAKNNLGLPVGLAFIGPDKINDEVAIFSIDGKTISIPLNICCSLVRIKEKASTKLVKESTESSKGLSTTLIEAIDQSPLRHDFDGIPESVTRLLPNINFKDIKEVLYSQTKGVYADYEGNVHETLADCDVANTVIRHKMIQAVYTDLITEKLNSQWEALRFK